MFPNSENNPARLLNKRLSYEISDSATLTNLFVPKFVQLDVKLRAYFYFIGISVEETKGKIIIRNSKYHQIYIRLQRFHAE